MAFIHVLLNDILNVLIYDTNNIMVNMDRREVTHCLTLDNLTATSFMYS